MLYNSSETPNIPGRLQLTGPNSGFQNPIWRVISVDEDSQIAHYKNKLGDMASLAFYKEYE